MRHIEKDQKTKRRGKKQGLGIEKESKMEQRDKNRDKVKGVRKV